MTYPDVKPPVHEDKREAPLGVRQAYPHFAVHQKAMMKVDDALPYAVPSRIDFPILLPLSARQPVEAEQKAILGLQHMFLGLVSRQTAEVDEVGRIADRRRDGWVPLAWFGGFGQPGEVQFLRSSARFCAGVVNLSKARRDAR
jgi:hypothetical protein